MNFNKLTDVLAKIIADILLPFYKLYKKVKKIDILKIKNKFVVFVEKIKNISLLFDFLKNKFNNAKNSFNENVKGFKLNFFESKNKKSFFIDKKDLLSKYKFHIAISIAIFVSIFGTYKYMDLPITSEVSSTKDKSVALNLEDNKEIIKNAASSENSVSKIDDEKNVDKSVEQVESVDNEVKNEVEKYKSQVKDIITMSYSGYELSVNGRRLGFFKYKSEAQDVLNDLKTGVLSRVSGNILESYFKEDVKVDRAYTSIISKNVYTEKDKVYNYIVKGTNEEKFHKVKKGENFWTIASKYEITVDSLLKANPDIKPERLQIGQTISLTVPRPLITVLTVEEATYIDDIAYDVKYEEASNMYKGDYKTKIKGVKGEKEVVAKVIKENGREVGKQILSEKIIKEPSTKVVYKGIKNPPPRIGTGTFARPTKGGVITSGFGMRWGRKHNGIDIGIPTGTSVYAADGGVVLRAGWYSGYGLAVVIDHGANMISIYGHNSKILVKKGDKVFKGQRVALSGNTGRSTGPHLHFEIRKNNVPVDPRKYVKY